MLGRPTTFHNPKRVTVVIEAAEWEAAKATNLSWNTLIRIALRQCPLTRPEVILKLAHEEEKMAEEHEKEAAMHREKARVYFERVKQSPVVIKDAEDARV